MSSENNIPEDNYQDVDPGVSDTFFHPSGVDNEVPEDSTPQTPVQENLFQNEEGDVGEDHPAENYRGEEATVSEYEKDALADSLVISLKGEHDVAAVYNYIITEAEVVAPGTIQKVLEKIEAFLPSLDSTEQRYLLDLNKIGLDSHSHRAGSPFYELKRKFYALKYLLEGHVK